MFFLLYRDILFNVCVILNVTFTSQTLLTVSINSCFWYRTKNILCFAKENASRFYTINIQAILKFNKHLVICSHVKVFVAYEIILLFLHTYFILNNCQFSLEKILKNLNFVCKTFI